MTARHALAMALSAASLFVHGAGCRKTSSTPADAAAPEASVAAPLYVDASLEDARVADSEAKGSKDGGLAPSRTQEDLLEEAGRKVAEAKVEANEKKGDCDKIADLLDSSFLIADPVMSAEDRAAFFAFASCAKKKQRWRLLRAVANSIVAGDATQKTTYYLPRALVGLGQYDAANRLAATMLRAWPMDGEAYTTAALASTRIDDWDSCNKEADQAILIQRQQGLSDEITAQAHVFKAEALLHQGRIDDSSRELDVAKKIRTYELATKMRERNDVVKSLGLIVDADLPDEVPLALYPSFLKSLPFTGGLTTLRLTNLTDKPLIVRVEVSLSGMAEPIGRPVTVVKGRRETVRLTPPLRPDFRVDALKSEEKRELAYKVSSPEGQVFYEDSRKVTVLPRDRLPFLLQMHESDEKPAPELASLWITPASKVVVGLLDAAKKRAPAGQFAGLQGPTQPQIQALWDELRGRGFSFVRDPALDSEARRSHATALPAEAIGAETGNALEGSLLFATLMEAIGLDVVLVRVPGHAFVGWLPSRADRVTPESMNATVQSPFGAAFFLETTLVRVAPSDAAVLRGDAELVDAVSKKVFDDGRGSALRLSALRKMGIVPEAE
jgi:tetratricopeptide (TPR) repeat protein